MKINFKHSLLLLVALVVSAVLSRCSKNDEMGTPSISHVRVTDPTKSDSLLSIAGQGQMIAIMGQNLGTVQEVWFNDQKAQLITTFITNSTIITRIPSQLPTVITDKMKMVFANGSSLEYDFAVDIGKPSIDHVRSEYVNDGDSLFIYGSYLYEPLTVSFTGGTQGTLLSVSSDNSSIIVKVPTGVQPGPITIANTFGSVTSHFWFRDNRNTIASFDITPTPQTNLNNVWHVDAIVDSDPNMPNISGKFLRVNKGSVTSTYAEVYEGTQGSDLSVETKNIPQEAFTDPASYSLKFEINTLGNPAGLSMWLYLGNDNGCYGCGGDFGAARSAIHYVWVPNINTHGVWQTLIIPWTDVYAANKSFAYNSAGYGIAMVFINSGNLNLAFDNIRVVPNK